MDDKRDDKIVVEKTDELAVAVIGMAGRFPGAGSVAELWQNLQNGVESITFFTDEELLAAGVEPALLDNPKYVKAGRFLDGIDLFDAQFFGINPREAEIMDPQHRIFLECAWEALENAGYDPKTYPGAISLHAGVSPNTYVWNIFANRDVYRSAGHYQTVIGNDKDFLTSRVAYKLDLKGPSVTVQSSCSTSLVAVHLACQGLLNGESDIALAGGVSVGSPQKSGYLYQEEGILSPDGHCRAFDVGAQGTAGGMGVGIVVLKRLEDALAEGDSIQAVIKGSAINNDGSLKVGFTAPSVEGQAQVIQAAQLAAGVEAETISYIETHGTGTILGDPIEIAALTKAFRASTEEKGFCAIGSLKTNIGHLDAAAGVAGLIKTVLALKHKQIPPSLNCTEPNPQLDFANSPFYINTALRDWPQTATPRRAGVSSFGIGGTNAHLIVEEAPAAAGATAPSTSRAYQLLTVSARSQAALARASVNLSEHLTLHPEVHLSDVAHTLQFGRSAFPQRRAVVCRDLTEAVAALTQPDLQPLIKNAGAAEGEPPAVVFMFPGQGTQYVGMGEELYRTEPRFRQTIDRCCEVLQAELGRDLKAVLYPPNRDQRPAAGDELNQTWLAQPALFAVEYALAQLWMSWGVQPRALIGHSLGEYVAACVSGVMELEEGLRLVARRGRLMQEQERGAMLAVACSEEKLSALLEAGVSLAAVNGPQTCVVAGGTDAIENFAAQLVAQRIASQPLHTSHAFHSTLMEPMLEQFTEEVRKVNLRTPRIPYLSNLTGTWITDAEATSPVYWAKHLRQTVRFGEGLGEVLRHPSILLEVGPGKTLTGLATVLAKVQIDKSVAAPLMLTSMRRANEAGSDEALLLTTLGRLWTAGVAINWAGFQDTAQARRIPLPAYPFERQRYWVDPQNRPGRAEARAQAANDKQEMSKWFYAPSWKRTVAASANADLDSSWLVFADDCGLGARLVERLEMKGRRIFTMKKGEEFARVGERAYVVNPRRQADYLAVLEEVRGAGNGPPSKITHFWSVKADDELQEGPDYIREIMDDFSGLLFLVNAIEEQDASLALQVEIVLNNAQEVTGEETLHAEKAVMLGASQIVAGLYPAVECRTIDVVLAPQGSEQEETLTGQLCDELLAATKDTAVAYRARHRWTQTFDPVQLNETAETASRLKDGGTYLITDGLGDLSLVFAACIARKVQANIVLTSLEDFPAKEEWDEWLAVNDVEDAVSRRIRKLQSLESLGAQVLLFTASVTDQAQMREVIAQTMLLCGEINGVIYWGEVGDGKTMQLKETPKGTCPFSAEAIGLCVIDDLLKKADLDWIVLCSPLASILGESDQAASYAASAYLNAFAGNKFVQPATYTVSINWDTWQPASAPAAPESRLDAESESNLVAGISPEEAAEVFDRILLRGTLPQVIVSTRDLEARIAQNRAAARVSVRNELDQTQLAQPAHPRPELDNSYVAPANETERLTAKIWQELFGIEQIGANDNFIELGGHSLMAAQLIIRLRDAFAVEIPLRALFDTPTVAELAAAIVQIRELNPTSEISKISPVDRGNEAQLLSTLDHLSDEEVAALLGGMLAEQAPATSL